MGLHIDKTVQLSPTQKRFLACFAQSASITRSCRWAKVSRQAHYNWLEEELYAAAFVEAEQKAARTLHDEAIRRAHQGLTKAVRYKGKIVGYETEYSDSLLLALLKAHIPDKFRERSDVTHSGDVTITKRLIGVPVEGV